MEVDLAREVNGAKRRNNTCFVGSWEALVEEEDVQEEKGGKSLPELVFARAETFVCNTEEGSRCDASGSQDFSFNGFSLVCFSPAKLRSELISRERPGEGVGHLRREQIGSRWQMSEVEKKHNCLTPSSAHPRLQMASVGVGSPWLWVCHTEPAGDKLAPALRRHSGCHPSL